MQYNFKIDKMEITLINKTFIKLRSLAADGFLLNYHCRFQLISLTKLRILDYLYYSQRYIESKWYFEIDIEKTL